MTRPLIPVPLAPDYTDIHNNIVGLLETACRAAARSVNTLMTATYWEIGRRMVRRLSGTWGLICQRVLAEGLATGISGMAALPNSADTVCTNPRPAHARPSLSLALVCLRSSAFGQRITLKK